MEIQNLKNYGLSVAEVGNKVPKEIQREVKGYLIRKLLHSMGLLGMLRFFINVKKEKKRIAKHSFKVLNKSDILVSGFTRDRINAAAMFSALSKAIGQLPAIVLSFLAVGGKMLPALGFAILLNQITSEKWMVVLFILGWTLTSSLAITTTTLVFIAAAIALVYVMAKYNGTMIQHSAVSMEGEEYDE